jgi:hypothetical protein
MTLRTLTKIANGDHNKNKPMVFRDYHTGAIYHCTLHDKSLACSIPVGGDCLSYTEGRAWTHVSS